MNRIMTALVAAFCASVVVGCGDSGSPTGGSGGDGGSPSEGGSGGAPPPPTPPACYDESVATAVPAETFDGITLNQGLCVAQQLTDVYAACIGASATTDACDGFKAADPANEACLNCVVPGGAAPFPLSVILPSEAFQYLTLFGCQAQAMGLPECAVPIESLLFCGRTACESCPDDASNNDCVNYAINPPAICGEVGLPTGCEAVFSATELDPACIGDATGFETAFAVLAELYCGAR